MSLVYQINSFQEVLKLAKMFRKNKVITALTLISERAVLNGNDVFSILVVSTKKRYSSFLEKIFVFQKICFKVKLLKTFETLTDCHLKTYQSPKRRTILKIPSMFFLEESMFFLLALK